MIAYDYRASISLSWRVLLLTAILLCLVIFDLSGKDLGPPSAKDVWQIGRRELEFLNALPRSPQGFVLDAYTQFLGAKEAVISDSWNLARVSLGPGGLIVVNLVLPPAHAPVDAKTGKQKASYFQTFAKLMTSASKQELPIRPDGVAYMIFPDSAGVGTDRYMFQYLGVEVLGDLRTWTFMLKPKGSAGPGGFSGKIWVADHDIVRFSGTFSSPSPRQKGAYVSFDSIRFKTVSGHWVPWRTYLDQTDLPPNAPGSRALRARITMRSFDSQGLGLSGSVGVGFDDNVDAAHASETQIYSEDVYLESEQNFVRWLEGIGFMSPVGKLEREVCDPIIQDIVKTNHVELNRTLTCRILLTTPAETVLFESTIGVSRTVFDLAPNTATIAVLIAREIALEKLRSNHLDLVWGRPDTLQRQELDLIRFLGIAPPQSERDQADDLALEYLSHLTSYGSAELQTAGVFLHTASEACKTTQALLEPRFGDGLPGCGRDAHISRMALAAPPGSDQNPALHIGSRININPWSNTVSLLKAQEEHAPFRIIPEPMVPGVAPDDPPENKITIVQPAAGSHWPPPPVLAKAKGK